MLVLLAAGVRLTHLRSVAEVLDDNWDLLDRIERAAAAARARSRRVARRARRRCATRATTAAPTTTGCSRASANLAEYRDRLRAAFDDAERIELLRADKPSFKVSRTGNKKNWADIDACASGSSSSASSARR